MKNFQKIMVLFIVVSLMVSILPANGFAVEAISINQTKNLIVGDSKPLVLTGAAVDEVTWISSDESVATVDAKGIVTGVSTGRVTVTATRKDDASVTASVSLRILSSYPYDVEWSGTFTSANNNTTTTTILPNDPKRVQQAWSAHVGNNTIVIVDDYIYTYNGIGESGEGTFYKVDKDTGSIVDTFPLPISTGWNYSYLIYGGGLLYVCCPESVSAIDPDSFTPLWTVKTPFKAHCSIQYVNGFLVTNGSVLNATTGELVKTLEGQAFYDWASGAEVGNRFYVADSRDSGKSKLYAFDTATWEKTDELEFQGSGAGVMHYEGWLYWADKVRGYLHTVHLDGGNFADNTYLEIECGYITFGAPVAAGGRVYLAGYMPDGGEFMTGIGGICVLNAATKELVYKAQLTGAGHKIQDTPILSTVTSGGNVVAGLNVPQTMGTVTNYVYVQDYASPGTIYVLTDDSSKTSGTLTKLISPDPGNFAWEQLACDKEGALYITNDANYLQKYVTAKISAPVITVDLSTSEVTYGQSGTADTLTVMAISTDSGNISYQWQSRREDGVFANISGATANNYTPSTQNAGTAYYRCVVTNTLSGEKATATSSVAKITVLEKKVVNGDINGDGLVNTKDVTALRRYLAGWAVNVQLDAADLYVDGKINTKDVTKLRQKLAGW